MKTSYHVSTVDTSVSVILERRISRLSLGRIAVLSSMLAGALLSGCGDDKSESADTNCAAMCDKQQGCPMDSSKEDCVTECEALAAQCPAQAKAANDCTLARPQSDFTCDVFGETQLKDGLCENESTAVIACALGGQVLDPADTSSVPSDSAEPDPEPTASATPSASASITPTPSATGPELPPPQEVAMQCESYCEQLEQLGCSAPTADCEMECVEAQTQIAATGCVEESDALTACAFLDVPNNFECNENGEPDAKPGVCAAEQSALQACALAEIPSTMNEACVEACANGSLTPPVTCPNDSAEACELSCDALSLFGDCGQAFLAANQCAAAEGAEHWSCNDSGAAEFDGTTCVDEQLAATTCLLGGLSAAE